MRRWNAYIYIYIKDDEGMMMQDDSITKYFCVCFFIFTMIV
jgi:hypothetical protein